MENPFSVHNETNKLKKLIIHRPDEGIELVTPDKATEYLYEDIVFLKEMQEEHDLFTQIIRFFIGKDNVLDIQDLLIDILAIKRVKDDLVDAVCQFENCPEQAIYLRKISDKRLSNIIITGYDQKQKKVLFSPVSNLIFCRDIGVTIGTHILIAEASKKARSRESMISRFIFRYHPIFFKNHLIEISSFNTFLDNAQRDDKTFSIEGGDVMMVHPGHLLIGHSERTTIPAIEELCKYLFLNNVVNTITRVSLPKERYCMHLDTIFTMVNESECIAFEPLVCQAGKMEVVQYLGDCKTRRAYPSLFNMLVTIFPKLKVIPCGGGVWPYAEREQWTDGCNIFAIKNGVGVTYDRNHYTSKALKENGYTLLNAKKLLKDFKSGKLLPENIERSIILIPSNELSRARGGTHCLTMPLVRD